MELLQDSKTLRGRPEISIRSLLKMTLRMMETKRALTSQALVKRQTERTVTRKITMTPR